MSRACTTGEHDTHDVFNANCPCRELLDVIANKWSALAIGALASHPLRFGELRTHLDGVTPKVLTATLRRLESFGLVHREVYAAVPLHVEYSLTQLGRSAVKPLAALRAWAEEALDHQPA